MTLRMISAGVEDVVIKADQAFREYKKVNAADRAVFMKKIAEEIDLLGDELIHLAMNESHLTEVRIRGERGRTINQLNSFAELLHVGEWVNASIDVADADRKPAPKPGLRKMLFPIGPVVVFGASNFPLAFSTAGGDTASALAAGCSVIVKSHPAHPKTSALVARAIQRAAELCRMPKNVFQHIEDSSIEIGQQLVIHPLTKAAAFTGSYQAGKTLFDLANKREEPIPVFSEMGSVNPVVLLPACVKQNKELPSLLASSITLGVGQFCTNPGLLLAIDDSTLDSFLTSLSEALVKQAPAKMLHTGIAKNFEHRKKESLLQRGVTTLADVVIEEEGFGAAALGVVSVDDFLKNSLLKEEVFGPYSLVVKCSDKAALLRVIKSLKGQLTATLFAWNDEINNYTDVVDALHQCCGRLIFNGVPTGVEVCKSMHHGGPFPSTTDSRFTSVGVDAIYRFVRPVSFQDFPNDLLPIELRNYNKLNILRCVNGTWTRDHI